MREIPERFVRYLPKGHRVWFSPREDVEGKKKPEQRNPNAVGGTNRRDWLLCVCGNGHRLEQVMDENGQPQSTDPTEQDWLDLVNSCRLAVHSLRQPCPPVDFDGVEQIVRDAPPETKTVTVPSSETHEPVSESPARRPKKLLEV